MDSIIEAIEIVVEDSANAYPPWILKRESIILSIVLGLFDFASVPLCQ